MNQPRRTEHRNRYPHLAPLSKALAKELDEVLKDVSVNRTVDGSWLLEAPSAGHPGGPICIQDATFSGGLARLGAIRRAEGTE